MNYLVQFDPPAELHLAAIWMAPADQTAVTDAVTWIETRLSRNLLRLGESCESFVHRIMFRPPIGVEYEVVEDDKLVLVHGVFAIA
jgi:hypothetical protein